MVRFGKECPDVVLSIKEKTRHDEEKLERRQTKTADV